MIKLLIKIYLPCIYNLSLLVITIKSVTYENFDNLYIYYNKSKIYNSSYFLICLCGAVFQKCCVWQFWNQFRFQNRYSIWVHWSELSHFSTSGIKWPITNIITYTYHSNWSFRFLQKWLPNMVIMTYMTWQDKHICYVVYI